MRERAGGLAQGQAHEVLLAGEEMRAHDFATLP
jgi:hypothetical protein